MDFHKYLKPGITVLVALTGLWVGSRLFTYFTYNSEPEFSVIGIEDGKSYKGVVACRLQGESGYKVATMTVLLDGDRLGDLHAVGAKQFSVPFNIETKELAYGEHVVTVEAVDASYHANKRVKQVAFCVDNTPLKAAFLQPEYKVDQGHTLHTKIQMNKQVEAATIEFLSKKYICYPVAKDSTIYESFVPVECEQFPDHYAVKLEIVDKVGNLAKLESTVEVKAVDFPRQKGFHVSQEKLDDEKEVSMNNKILSTALDKWLAHSSKEKMWKGAFEMPTVVQRISTPFGEIRVTPQKGRYHHAAIDIVNTPKSVVWASQNGKVIIKDRYLFSGNTVVIDHGLGVFTKYFHLDDFADIEVGEFIKKGQPVGRLGVTGYANGYHLHWELSINGVSVDPVEWTKRVF